MTDEPESFDVVIIGAGVNGAGVFRDLCAQGLKCLLIDKGDFGSGTSAAPSRLIHGGLKYLETGEFRLVAESTYERNLLLRNAAHLVEPLPTAIPILSWTKGINAALRTLLGSTTAPRSRGALLIKIGLSIYDFYGSRARQMPRHRMVGRTRALSEIPALTPRIVAVGTYHDARINAPERLVLELVKDGLGMSPGSEALNWCDFEGFWGGALQLVTAFGERRQVSPTKVVNAAGPWIDGVNAALGLETNLIGGTKGSHILLDHPELQQQLDGRMLYFEAEDGRILLVLPFLGRILVGSTDIADDSPDEAVCTAAETEYLLQGLRGLLPGLDFDKKQILFSYAGVRPLPNSAGVEPGLISRDHSAAVAPPTADRPFSVFSLVGGKWTTFRAFSAEVADMVLEELGRKRLRATDRMPIGGGRDMPQTPQARAAWISRTAHETGTPEERVATLLRRYGTTARQIAELEGAAPPMLADAEDYSEPEIEWILRTEHVVHLSDILLRRTPLAITGRLTAALCECVATVAARALDWDAKRLDWELSEARAVLADRHGVRLDLEPRRSDES